MPQKTPAKYLQIGKFYTQPVKSVAEYCASIENKKCFMKPPHNDCDFEVMYFYSDAKLDNEIHQQFFDIQYAKYLKRQKLNDARNKLAKTQQIKLHENFIRFNDFLRDLEEKRKVAYKKIGDELKEQTLLREQIDEKKESIKDSIIFLQELKYTTDQYRLYESVLENVVEKTGQYESVKDLITRCDAIMFAYDNITMMDDKLCQKIELMRIRMMETIKKANLMALGMKNKLSELQRSYEHTALECLKWERQYRVHQEVVLQNESKKLRALDGINGLYRLFCKRRGLLPSVYGTVVGDALETQLGFVRDEYFLIAEVLEEYHRRHGIKTVSVGVKVKRKC